MPTEDPLNKQHVTEGSTDVLPAYPISFVSVGLLLIGQDTHRTDSHAFDGARQVFDWLPWDPMHTWAVVFLSIGLVEAWAWRKEDRRLFRWCLIVGAGVVAFWATLLLLSAFADPLVSFTGAVWLYFIAWCHKASVKSLSRDKVFKEHP